MNTVGTAATWLPMSGAGRERGELGFYITQGAYIKEVKNKNELKTIIGGLKRITG